MQISPFYSTKLGKLYKGDCLKVMDYLIENNYKFDAIITVQKNVHTPFSHIPA